MGATPKKEADSTKFNLEGDILEQIPAMVMSVDKDFQITSLNATGRKMLGMSWEDVKGRKCSSLFNTTHCDTPDCGMRQAMEHGKTSTSRTEISVNGKTMPIEYTACPLKDDDGNIVGGLEYAVDITERVRNEEMLREQSRTIREISTPAIKLWDGIVILPVVGVVDSARAQQMMEAMLTKVMETSAKVIILDIQGVAAVDTAVANHLIKITKATRLMGCRCIISGISPIVAQTIVQLGIDLGEVETNSTLRDALQNGLNLLGVELRNRK